MRYGSEQRNAIPQNRRYHTIGVTLFNGVQGYDRGNTAVGASIPQNQSCQKSARFCRPQPICTTIHSFVGIVVLLS